MPNARFTLAAYVALAGLAVTSCSSRHDWPPGVPLGAAWLPGPDGGLRLECLKLAGDRPKYECSAYHSTTGRPYSVGEYHPDYDPNRFTFLPRSYDGLGLITLSDTTHMRAQGVVIFPRDSLHGKRVHFQFGKATTIDSAY